MDLSNITAASDYLATGPRGATAREIRSYLDWLAARRGIPVPDDAGYGPQGIYCPTAKALILKMPGYGQSQTVTCELLDDAGEVTRTITLPVDKRGKLPMTPQQAKDWTGLTPVRATRRKPAASPAPVTSEHAPLESAPMIDTPAPAIAPVIASEPVSAPIDPVAAVLDTLEAETPMPAADMALRIDAAAVVALAAIAAAPTHAATVQGANAIWMQFVTDVTGAPVDRWVVSSGPQRDRKARNRGKVVIAGHDIEAMRAAFETVMGGRYAAVGLPAPAPAVSDAAPADDLAAVVAALAARVAGLERAAAGKGRAPRTAGHAAAIRRAWAMRAQMRARADLDRRALLKVNADNRFLLEKLQTVEAARDQAAKNEAAARADIRKACDRAIDAQARADALRDDLVTAETMLSRQTCEFTTLATTAAADRARLDQLAPLLAAIGSIGQPAPAPATV